LVPELLKEGQQVRALVLPGEDDSPLRSLGVEIHWGDLRDESSLLSALSGVDLCYHLAGINSFWMPRTRDYYEVNVEGVRRLLKAARQAGVKRVVHTSSAVTIGERRGEMGNEATIHRGYFLSHYERSKYLGEKEALAMAQKGLEVVVVNPTSAYGPGRTRGSGKVFLDFLRGRLPGIFGGKINLLYIEDMVKGHLLAAERGKSGERYILAGENLPMEETFRVAAEMAGSSRIPSRLPTPLVWAISWAGHATSLFTRRPPRLPRDQVRAMLHGICVDHSKAKRELGMEFTPFRVGLARTIEGYRKAGLIPGPSRAN
jgi:dihydroflavonol-4-reductase